MKLKLFFAIFASFFYSYVQAQPDIIIYLLVERKIDYEKIFHDETETTGCFPFLSKNTITSPSIYKRLQALVKKSNEKRNYTIQLKRLNYDNILRTKKNALLKISNTGQHIARHIKKNPNATHGFISINCEYGKRALGFLSQMFFRDSNNITSYPQSGLPKKNKKDTFKWSHEIISIEDPKIIHMNIELPNAEIHNFSEIPIDTFSIKYHDSYPLTLREDLFEPIKNAMNRIIEQTFVLYFIK